MMATPQPKMKLTAEYRLLNYSRGDEYRMSGCAVAEKKTNSLADVRKKAVEKMRSTLKYSAREVRRMRKSTGDT